MARKKIRSQAVPERQLKKPNSFIYKLISNQRFLAIVGLVFLIIIIFPLAKTYSQRRLIEKEIEGIKAEISQFENQNQELKEIISYLESEQSLEEQARLSLNMKKPGEQVIVIEEKDMIAKGEKNKLSFDTRSNFRKWWNYFFN